MIGAKLIYSGYKHFGIFVGFAQKHFGIFVGFTQKHFGISNKMLIFAVKISK